MANRYWVGGTAAWDATAGTKWSTTSGGAGGAAVPTAADDVFFNAASGAVTCTISGSRTCLSLNCTGFTGTLTGASTPVLTISGNLTFASGMSVDDSLDLVFNATNTRTITNAGRSAGSYNFNGVGGTWIFQDALNNNGGAFSENSVTLTNGTLNLNNFTLNTNTFYSNNSNTRTIAFGTGSITVSASDDTAAAWDAATATNLSITGTPNVIGASDSSFFSFPVYFRHGSTAGGTEANAINFSPTGSYRNIDLELSGAFKNVNLSGIASSSNLVSATRTIYGNLTLDADMALNASSNVTTFAATSGTQDITSNGRTMDFPLTQSGVGGTVRLLDALTLGATRAYTLTNGTFNANNFNVSVGSFSSSNSNTRTLMMGSGAWTLSGTTGSVWDTATTTGLTFNKNTANITLSATGTTTRTFAGGSLTYNDLSIGGTTGASTTTFTGGSTFGAISSTKTVAQTILFTPGTTTTVANWTITGSAGNVLTIGSVGGAAQHTLAKTGGGTVTVNYASISYSNATPANTWAATNSTNGGANDGWTFLQGSGFFLFF